MMGHFYMGIMWLRDIRWRVLAALVVMILPPQLAHAEKRKLLVGSFQDVTVYGDMQVNIITGKGASASATGDRRILDLLRLERDSEHLVIRVQTPPNDDNKIRVTQPLIISLSTSHIRNISVSGNAKIRVSKVAHDNASRIIMDGGGEIEIGAIKTDKLLVAITGTGRVNIAAGSARESSLRIQGAGSFDASNMQVRKFQLEKNGNADVAVRVDESATISNVGAGRITVNGNAECFIRKAGSAIITCPKDKKSTVIVPKAK
jgi:Putative auto-transporter adhesin, head GIN domain